MADLISRSALIPPHASNYRHGCYYEPWYGSYKAMMDRCYRKKANNYPHYGGRGIAVCEEWHNPKVFGEWAVSNGFRKGLTLDRIDGTKGYSPDNCRWATPREQGNNRETNIPYEYNGEAHTLNEWARIVGMNKHTLWSRIHKSNWTFEKAITTPTNGKYSRKAIGERKENEEKE